MSYSEERKKEDRWVLGWTMVFVALTMVFVCGGVLLKLLEFMKYIFD